MRIVGLILILTLGQSLPNAGPLFAQGQPPKAGTAPARTPPAPATLPGTSLDPRFRRLPAQSVSVRRAAPAWLRAKASGSPAYIVDGQMATAAQLRQLRPEHVASVNVLDSAKAVRLYGANARDGLVLVTTKTRHR